VCRCPGGNAGFANVCCDDELSSDERTVVHRSEYGDAVLGTPRDEKRDVARRDQLHAELASGLEHLSTILCLDWNGLAPGGSGQKDARD
jgi:hypothetical protein